MEQRVSFILEVHALHVSPLIIILLKSKKRSYSILSGAYVLPGNKIPLIQTYSVFIEDRHDR
jgi:hypothetical protein